MKHEQAIVVSLAYVIGFTTAFIAFAINGDRQNRTTDYSNVIASSGVVQRAAADQGVSVESKSDGLYVVKDGEERIISAVGSGNDSGPGFHTTITTASISPSGHYVHYCAENDSTRGGCFHFVYSVQDDVVYQIKDGGSALESSNGDAALTTWLSDDTLNVSGSAIASAATLWQVR